MTPIFIWNTGRHLWAQITLAPKKRSSGTRQMVSSYPPYIMKTIKNIPLGADGTDNVVGPAPTQVAANPQDNFGTTVVKLKTAIAVRLT